MFAEYLQAAMRHGTYKQYSDGSYFGSIPEFKGVWANAPTLEACREELLEVLEGWLLLAIAEHDDLPEIDGHKLIVKAGV